MSDHDDGRQGSMDLTEHERTWQGFMALSKYGSLAVIALVFFLVLFLVAGWSWYGAAFAVIGFSVAIAYFFG